MSTNTITAVQIQGITATDSIQKIKDEVKNLLPTTQPTTETPTVKLMTRKEVAKLFNVSLVTVHHWTRAGRLRAYRIGNQLRYKETEVLNALECINAKRSENGTK